MRLKLLLGATAAAIMAATAYAQAHPTAPHVIVRHGGPGMGMGADIDADHDGWVTRAEASAAAERIFADIDTNDDGRLTSEDHGSMEMQLSHGAPGEDCDQTVEGEGNERRVTVICRNESGDEQRTERRVTILRGGEHVSEQDMHRLEQEAERAELDAERAERHAEHAEHSAQHVERQVWVMRSDGDPAAAPMPPMPPHPPMFMMMIANSDESDLNSDGALSLDEFRAQHLRFFDASDANGDGRVRMARPPEPPAPSAAPEPPQPPRRR